MRSCFPLTQDLNRTTQLTAANGKKVEALIVFSLSIKFMKDEAVKIIRARTGENYSANDIQWVLTVPAIWRPAAKQFMREAAYKVGCKKHFYNLDTFRYSILHFVERDGEMLRAQRLQLNVLYGQTTKNNCNILIRCPAQPNTIHLSCNMQPLMGCVNTSRV